MRFKIEKNIPIVSSAGRHTHYPFEEMKIGDSFLINGKNHLVVGTCARRFALLQNPSWKFTVRKTEDGYRCWRVE